MNNPASTSTSTLTLSSSSSSMQYSNVPMTMTCAHMPSSTKTMVNRMMTLISPLVPRLVRLFFDGVYFTLYLQGPWSLLAQIW